MKEELFSILRVDWTSNTYLWDNGNSVNSRYPWIFLECAKPSDVMQFPESITKRYSAEELLRRYGCDLSSFTSPRHSGKSSIFCWYKFGDRVPIHPAYPGHSYINQYSAEWKKESKLVRAMRKAENNRNSFVIGSVFEGIRLIQFSCDENITDDIHLFLSPYGNIKKDSTLYVDQRYVFEDVLEIVKLIEKKYD